MVALEVLAGAPASAEVQLVDVTGAGWRRCLQQLPPDTLRFIVDCCAIRDKTSFVIRKLTRQQMVMK